MINLEQLNCQKLDLRGAGYIAPPEKYLLHDREIHSVLYLGHYESLYHVMYFFDFLDCSKFIIF